MLDFVQLLLNIGLESMFGALHFLTSLSGLAVMVPLLWCLMKLGKFIYLAQALKCLKRM